jgi:geranylgeranyl diphosphate synthase type II
LGEAYQVADDIRDVIADAATLGKPVGQDALLARPSSAQALGLDGAIAHFDRLIDQAAASIPACSCRDMLRQLVQVEAERLVPKALCEGYFKTHPQTAVPSAPDRQRLPH